MKILQLPDVLHEYLVHVVEKHAQQGIHPEEGVAIAHLWEAVTKQVQTIDDKELMKMAVAGTPGGQSTPVTPTADPVQDKVYPEVKE
jgi:hypothetical protein